MRLLDFIFSEFSKRAAFYKFERKVIDEVALYLPSDAGKLLLYQIDRINKIQRLSDGKEVNLYCIRHGRAAFDESLRFPDKKGELLLASAKLVHPGKRSKLKAEVWVANGRIFSIVFDKVPQKFFAGLNLDTLNVEIVDVQVWFNPMQPRHTSEPLEDTQNLSGWLSVLRQYKQLEDTRKPLSEEERNVLLTAIDAQLPTDYLDAIKQTEGFTVDNCKVLGLSEIRKVTLPEQNYYIIAEIEGQAGIALMQGEKGPDIYWLDYENDTVQPHKLGSSLREYLLKLCRSGTDKCD
ncbi:MAG: hypothetical protein HQK56_15075 [Deltaproteobacteria bacterium]|nr:hypothetical protein [Deltaproteobacteria bacterium]